MNKFPQKVKSHLYAKQTVGIWQLAKAHQIIYLFLVLRNALTPSWAIFMMVGDTM